MQAAVGDGTLVHPGAEDGADRRPDLVFGRLWEGLPGLLQDLGLVVLDDLGPILGREFGVEQVAAIFLGEFENLLEVVMVDPQHHVTEHLNETAVAVVGEAPVVGGLGQARDGIVVEAEIEHRVHHAGHGGAPARAHGDQQRVAGIPELGADQVLDRRQGAVDLGLEVVRVAPVIVEEIAADFRGDGEAGRYRQPERGHLRQVGALAAEQFLHIGPTVGGSAAEAVHPLGHGLLSILMKRFVRA